MMLPQHQESLLEQITIGNIDLKILQIRIPVLINPGDIQVVGSEDIVAERFIVPSTEVMEDIFRGKVVPEAYNAVYQRLLGYYNRINNNANIGK